MSEAAAALHNLLFLCNYYKMLLKRPWCDSVTEIFAFLIITIIINGEKFVAGLWRS